jgi:ABC-type nitrate/sulfonate/bicarbonate transport system ATPase subunit
MKKENAGSKIACEDISKIFIQKGTQKVHVLHDINFNVQDNEFLIILGPGQCGKTTLLRIVAGLETPTDGKTYLNGEEVTLPGPDRGIVFQKYMLFEWRTVLENVMMGPKLRGMPKDQCFSLAMKFIKLVGLEHFENLYPHQLSGGMKQRVGIARAYVNYPEVMLLDEPFGQLDAQTRIFMEQETVRIWEHEKRTVLFVTNNIDEAIYLGDRIVTMKNKMPGIMDSVYNVDLPRPRDFTDLKFLQLRHEITEASELVL